ncbi:MAG: DUF898 domain-containing protein [Rhodanobacter denitrificans]|uniref:DUF898 domain-containing protein n=1 Tax=Rhodanobacter denitrificans TaxID=666685 RepID=A0A2W5M634_9GAMM|nr:MAG: DUF898 domain-containing protein [Rhodanobacter denitrificans]
MQAPPIVSAGIWPEPPEPPAPPEPIADVPAAVPPRVPYRFAFDGTAGEYFRIWIVNLALSLVTLGLYSAWAKVRTQRYFYGNTRLDGVPFEYLARPLPILAGRIVAVALFLGYVLAGQLSLWLQIGLALLIAVATPWLLVRGAAFRARYSSWRGLRFRFVPDYAQAYVRYLWLGIPLVLTLGLLYPYVKARQKAFLVEHHRYGGQAFGFEATAGQFYPPYLIAWAVMTVWVFVGTALLTGAAIALHRPGAEPPAALMFGWMALFYGGYFAIWAFLAAALGNLVYNHTTIGQHRFQSRLQGSRLLWFYASNTVAVLASAGLLIPWARIRLARYRAERLAVLAGGSLAAFGIEHGQDVDAAAAEIDSLFDIDIGL